MTDDRYVRINVSWESVHASWGLFAILDREVGGCVRHSMGVEDHWGFELVDRRDRFGWVRFTFRVLR